MVLSQYEYDVVCTYHASIAACRDHLNRCFNRQHHLLMRKLAKTHQQMTRLVMGTSKQDMDAM